MKENTTDNKEKKAFVAPKLSVHGDVEVLTMGFSTGTSLDKSFPVGTPNRDLTFS